LRSSQGETAPESAKPFKLTRKIQEEPIPLTRPIATADTVIPLSVRDFEEVVEGGGETIVSESGEQPSSERVRADLAVQNTVSYANESFQNYKPKFLGKGGEHLVMEFEDPKHRDVVYKVNFFKTMPSFLAATGQGFSMESALQRMQESVHQRKADIKKLQTYFGRDAVPGERQMIRNVPFSMEIVRAIEPGALKDVRTLPEELPAVVVVQKRLDYPEGTMMLKGEYPERRMLELAEEREDAEEIYDESHRLLTGQYDTQEDPASALALVRTIEPDLIPVIDHVESDPLFRQNLQETVKKMFAFARETEMALDFAGEGNVAMMPKDGSWQLKLPDAILPSGWSMKDLMQTTLKLKQDPPLSLSPYEINATLNALNSVKTMNALAIIAGVEDRLKPTQIDQVPAERWRKSLGAIFTKPKSERGQQAA